MSVFMSFLLLFVPFLIQLSQSFLINGTQFNAAEALIFLYSFVPCPICPACPTVFIHPHACVARMLYFFPNTYTHVHVYICVYEICGPGGTLAFFHTSKPYFSMVSACPTQWDTGNIESGPVGQSERHVFILNGNIILVLLVLCFRFGHRFTIDTDCNASCTSVR